MDAMTDQKAKSTSSRWIQAFLAHSAAPVVLVMVSDLVFTSMDGFTQLVQVRGMPTGQVIFIRMSSNSILCLVYLFYYDRPALLALFYRSALNVWVRALMASVSSAGCYGAVSYIPLSVFMTLYHLRPFPTALACFLFLNERCTRAQVIACVISFSAVILVVQPFRHRSTVGEGTAWAVFLGVTMSLVSSLTGALDIVLCRQIGDGVGWVAMLFAYTTVGTFVGLGYTFVTGTGFTAITNPVDYMMLTSLSLSGFIAQMTMVLALQRASGMKVSLLGYFQIVWAALWQATVRSDPPNVVQILGMAIIVVAGSWAIVKGSPQEAGHDDKDAEAHISLTLSSNAPMTSRGDGYEPLPITDPDSGRSTTPPQDHTLTQRP